MVRASPRQGEDHGFIYQYRTLFVRVLFMFYVTLSDTITFFELLKPHVSDAYKVISSYVYTLRLNIYFFIISLLLRPSYLGITYIYQFDRYNLFEVFDAYPTSSIKAKIDSLRTNAYERAQYSSGRPFFFFFFFFFYLKKKLFYVMLSIYTLYSVRTFYSMGFVYAVRLVFLFQTIMYSGALYVEKYMYQKNFSFCCCCCC